MAENSNEQNNVNEVSQNLTTTLVGTILRKHGFKKENLAPISDEKKAELKSMVEDIKKQLESLAQAAQKTTTVPNNTKEPKAESKKKGRK
ncbi:hypothetical protein JOD43_002527 [Pullulanibacillus pueri]|uniref:Spore coat protein n=1 Tax=Pullulanibacillus pueri TaxID=1437324 RepID=A0A8J2ZVK7_9BACL|nr:hypothetical protein [Pullulanibacillus pueri]MBM7682352.1 hypothetical protein [Pullulanibacillus pueri]GGH80690.1 hypothetical protein GCM10007096_17470 [Pullulanibacillus pueri]